MKIKTSAGIQPYKQQVTDSAVIDHEQNTVTQRIGKFLQIMAKDTK